MQIESVDLAICYTCGTQYDLPLSSPPKSCRICDDPRQYVPVSGQSWTSLSHESDKQYNECTTDERDPHIHYISTKSRLADRKQLGIGQRAILIQTGAGNILWDLVSFIDQDTVDYINSKGGLKAIVVSHPHFYTTHLEWTKQFQCPVYLCKADEEWLNRADKDGMRQWVEGTREIVPGVTAIQAGGHFDGSMVLHWDKKLFIADTMMTVPTGMVDRNSRLPGTVSYSFMWSYPNMIPLSPAKIHGIWKAIKPFEFDATYGGFAGQNVCRQELKMQVLGSMTIFLKSAGHEKAAIYEESYGNLASDA